MSTFRIAGIPRSPAGNVDIDNFWRYEVANVNIDRFSSELETCGPASFFSRFWWCLPAASRRTCRWKARLVRTLVVDPKPIGDDRQAVGEVKPRYESDLSFRVAGKVLSRLVDVGAWVKQGDTLATLDTQDYQNRLRSAEADVSSAEAALVEAQGTEARQAKLLKDGWTPKATYDTALHNLQRRRGQAQGCQGQSRPHPRPAQLHHAQGRFRRRDYRRRCGSGPECECRPNGGEAGPTGRQGRRLQHRRDSLH